MTASRGEQSPRHGVNPYRFESQRGLFLFAFSRASDARHSKRLCEQELFCSLYSRGKILFRDGYVRRRLPEGFVTSASTEACPHAAVTCEVNGKRLYGLQLHPEVTHTVKGIEMLGAFVQHPRAYASLCVDSRPSFDDDDDDARRRTQKYERARFLSLCAFWNLLYKKKIFLTPRFVARIRLGFCTTLAICVGDSDWLRQCRARTIESVLESHGPCKSFELSIV